MYFIANWKMFGDLKSLDTLDKVIKFFKGFKKNKLLKIIKKLLSLMNQSGQLAQELYQNLMTYLRQSILLKKKKRIIKSFMVAQ